MMKLKAQAILSLVALIFIACVFYGFYRLGANNKHLEWQAKWDALQLELTKTRLEQEQNNRDLELSWQLQIDKVEAENVELQNRILANSVNADNASDRLLAEVDRYAKRLKTCTASSAAINSKTEATPDLLLPELLRKLDNRAGELARFADESRAAGLACEQYVKAIK
jgi:biopolymer transport protein ExbB/TolQ